MYTNGQALFLIEYLKALTTFRDTELQYGILPMPKLNEEQDRYYCGLAGYQAGMYCIPADVYDEELSSIITEAMAYHSQKIVTPAYYDRTLIGRSVQDLESEETLKIIFDSRIYDLGLFYRVGSLNVKLNSMMQSKNNQYASTIETLKKLIDKSLSDINGFFSSFAERMGFSTPHSTPISGSFQRIPPSASGA